MVVGTDIGMGTEASSLSSGTIFVIVIGVLVLLALGIVYYKRRTTNPLDLLDQVEEEIRRLEEQQDFDVHSPTYQALVKKRGKYLVLLK